ncbi:MAG: hypothetical protein ACRD3W_27650, partial [Terriglobales bacterium]
VYNIVLKPWFGNPTVTTVYSETAANNPDFPAQMAEAQKNITELAMKAIMANAGSALLAEGYSFALTKKALQLLLGQLQQGADDIGVSSEGADQVADQITSVLQLLN